MGVKYNKKHKKKVYKPQDVVPLRIPENIDKTDLEKVLNLINFSENRNNEIMKAIIFYLDCTEYVKLINALKEQNWNKATDELKKIISQKNEIHQSISDTIPAEKQIKNKEISVTQEQQDDDDDSYKEIFGTAVTKDDKKNDSKSNDILKFYKAINRTARK